VLLRIVKNSIRRRPRPLLLVLLSVIMGSSVATAFLGINGDLSRRMSLELRSYGANILVEPIAADQGGLLNAADLPRIKSIFWRHNITGFAPYLFGVADLAAGTKKERGVVTGTWFGRELAVEGEETTIQGVRVIAPWWEIAGRWPETPDEAIVGATLAARLGIGAGAELTATALQESRRFRVVGVVTTGGYEEEQVFAPLATVQSLLRTEGKVSRVLVSALTVPADDFGRKDPATMGRDEYEKWYCTAYVTSVAKNLEEVMAGSRAKPVWQIASAEGGLLRKLNGLMLLLTVLALGASATAVSSSLMASMAQRCPEIALMKAVGADRLQIIAIFMGEILILSAVGGVLGYLVGDRLTLIISRMVFDATIISPFWLFPTAILAALAVAVAGSVVPVRRALAIEPVRVLRG
jgi:putative ABC transport system permease protein